MKTLQHKFVEFIPDKINEGVIYISIEYCTAIHKCICGCGNEVVTPLSPTDWSLEFDGETISLSPSIGNWGFSCQTHYFIINNKIKLAKKWSTEKIKLGRNYDIQIKRNFYKKKSNQ